VTAIDTRAIGIAVVELGGGRRKSDDRIDPTVGFSALAPIGAAVGPDAPLAMVHARTAGGAERGAAALRSAFRVGDAASPAPALFHGRVAAPS
jgi:thymidine phosphorylase